MSEFYCVKALLPAENNVDKCPGDVVDDERVTKKHTQVALTLRLKKGIWNVVKKKDKKINNNHVTLMQNILVLFLLFFLFADQGMTTRWTAKPAGIAFSTLE